MSMTLLVSLNSTFGITSPRMPRRTRKTPTHIRFRMSFLQYRRPADARIGNEASCPRFPGLQLSCFERVSELERPTAAIIGIVLHSGLIRVEDKGFSQEF